MAIEVGDTALDFELESTDGTLFRLSDEVKKRPVLLNFYVGDFGINCTNYMTKFNERIGEIADAGASFIGINNDSMDSHVNFRDRLGLKWELLCDSGKNVAQKYGAIVGPGHMVTGFTNREFYLIDGNMKVVFKWKSSVPKELPEFGTILDGVRNAL